VCRGMLCLLDSACFDLQLKFHPLLTGEAPVLSLGGMGYMGGELGSRGNSNVGSNTGRNYSQQGSSMPSTQGDGYR
jgi:hypothetical protein